MAWSQVPPTRVKRPHPKFKITGSSAPTVSIKQPTRRGSSAIWVNVGTLKDHNDAFANPGEGATESLGRATAAVVFRGDTQRSSQVVGTSGPTLLWGVARWMTCRLTQSEGISRASVSRTASTCCVLAELRTDSPRLWMMPVDFGFCKTRTYTSGNVEVLSRGRRSYHPDPPLLPSIP